MIKALKDLKWIIGVSIACITLCILTFFTFINQGFIELNESNLQTLLLIDILLVSVFFFLVISKILKIIRERRRKQIGSETSSKYVLFFSMSTLLPAIFISVFSLILFNVGLQKYFNKKITSAVNNSYGVAQNYVSEVRNSIEADILMIANDVNKNSQLFYVNRYRFNDFLVTQRIIRKLDEIYLLDGSGSIIFSDLLDKTKVFTAPPEISFEESLQGKPVKLLEENFNQSSSLIKLENFIDTYLYVVKYVDPSLTNYLQDTEQAVDFYYTVQNNRLGIKISFALIYIIIVSLLLFLSIVISIDFASRLTNPIISLINASEKISSGNLEAKVEKIEEESDSEIKKLINTFNQMTERLKIQQEKLLTAERHSAWENVARKLAHEIKNPLTPIQLSIDRIKEKYLSKIQDNKEDFSVYLNTINKQIKDIEKLVNEFSDFARMPSPVIKKKELKKIISRSIDLNAFTSTDVDFKKQFPKKDVVVNADEEQVNRVFTNLIKNSLESLEEKASKIGKFDKKISIEIKHDNEYIVINIQDNGVGFRNTNSKEIIKPYFTTKQYGTGLGLAVVNKIISDHDWDLKFIPITEGAKIQIKIPSNYA